MDSPDFSFRFDCGVCMPSSSVSVDDKESIVRCISMHHTILYSQKAELDAIKEGFQVQAIYCSFAYNSNCFFFCH